MNNPETRIQNFTWLLWKEDAFIGFLKSMAAKGWVLCGFKRPNLLMLWQPYGYIFRKDEPQELEFRMDFRRDKKENLGDYIQLCTDTGWHHGCTFKGIHIFYTQEKTTVKADFFSDDESKIAKYKRLQKHLLVTGSLGILTMYYLFFHSWLSQHVSGFQDNVFMPGLIVFLAVFFLYSGWQFHRNIHHLRHKAVKKENSHKQWSFWFDVAIVITLTLALIPAFGFYLMPEFKWRWDWYFTQAFFMSFWVVFMVLTFGWVGRRKS